MGRKKKTKKDWVARAWKAAKTKASVKDAQRVGELVKELYEIFRKHRRL